MFAWNWVLCTSSLSLELMLVTTTFILQKCKHFHVFLQFWAIPVHFVSWFNMNCLLTVVWVIQNYWRRLTAIKNIGISPKKSYRLSTNKIGWNNTATVACVLDGLMLLQWFFCFYIHETCHCDMLILAATFFVTSCFLTIWSHTLHCFKTNLFTLQVCLIFWIDLNYTLCSIEAVFLTSA